MRGVQLLVKLQSSYTTWNCGFKLIFILMQKQA